MITLIAAALAAAAPAGPPADAHAGHMQMAQPGQHEHKDGCKCCKDMEAKMEGHHAERGE